MKVSAGLLMYKIKFEDLHIFLVHPGGPLFANKDIGYWGIPKGLIEEKDHNNLINAAKREFHEETNLSPGNELIDLGNIIQKNNKTVYCWAFEGDLPKKYKLVSNLFNLEWPSHSNNFQQYPEIDKGKFMNMETAMKKINIQQITFIKRLKDKIGMI